MLRIRRRWRRAWFIVLRDAPTRRCGASEGASVFDLSCWTNARFHLRKWLRASWTQSKNGLRSPAAAAASICSSLTHFSPSIFLFLSPFCLCFLQYVPLLPLRKPQRSSLICLYSRAPPCSLPPPSPLVLSPFIFFFLLSCCCHFTSIL